MATKPDATVLQLLRRVEGDPSAAVELLSIAAEYLKKREAMPDELADYLANAFRQVSRTRPPENGKRIEDECINQLAHGLYMKRAPGGGAPRKELPVGDITLTVAVYGEATSETKLKNELVSAYKGTNHEISPSTARNRIKEMKARLDMASKKMGEILKQNGLSTILRPRKFTK